MINMTVKFNLYGTEGCHLCEEALSLCLTVIESNDLKVVDIVDDEVLVEQYRVTIPVLERLDTQTKLFWPFGLSEITELV